jgi:hypothetical protein
MNSTSPISRGWIFVCLFVIVGAGLIVYEPSLNIGFWTDVYWHIDMAEKSLPAPTVHRARMVFQPTGGSRTNACQIVLLSQSNRMCSPTNTNLKLGCMNSRRCNGSLSKANRNLIAL